MTTSQSAQEAHSREQLSTPTDLKPEEREFATREAESALQSLSAVTDWQWINEPRRHRAADWKPAQLDVARRLGLTIPRTVITKFFVSE